MRHFTDSILLLLYSTLTFFYVPADQALVFALLFCGDPLLHYLSVQDM